MIITDALVGSLALTLGYLYSLVIGGAVIQATLKRFYRDVERPRPAEAWRTSVVGLVERALYTTSFLLGLPAFVAVWLVLKMAGQWARWRVEWAPEGRGAAARSGEALPRIEYSGYLLGNGLSIAFGIIGAMMIQRALAARWVAVSVLGSILLLAAGLLYLYILSQTRATRPERGTKPRASGSGRRTPG